MTAMVYDSWGSPADRFHGSMCLGIDLGTTNSCTFVVSIVSRFLSLSLARSWSVPRELTFYVGVGIWHVERNHVKIMKNRRDRGRTMPSVVHFDPQSQHVDVGDAAVSLRRNHLSEIPFARSSDYLVKNSLAKQ